MCDCSCSGCCECCQCRDCCTCCLKKKNQNIPHDNVDEKYENENENDIHVTRLRVDFVYVESTVYKESEVKENNNEDYNDNEKNNID